MRVSEWWFQIEHIACVTDRQSGVSSLDAWRHSRTLFQWKNWGLDLGCGNDGWTLKMVAVAQMIQRGMSMVKSGEVLQMRWRCEARGVCLTAVLSVDPGTGPDYIPGKSWSLITSTSYKAWINLAWRVSSCREATESAKFKPHRASITCD